MTNILSGMALCAVGLEKVTANELERLGFKTGDRRGGRVQFALDAKDPARSLAIANIGLRTAERVLFELGSFPAADFDQYSDCAPFPGSFAVSRTRLWSSTRRVATARPSLPRPAFRPWDRR